MVHLILARRPVAPPATDGYEASAAIATQGKFVLLPPLVDALIDVFIYGVGHVLSNLWNCS